MASADEVRVVVCSFAGKELCDFRSPREEAWRKFIPTLESDLKETLDDGHVLLQGSDLLGSPSDQDFNRSLCKLFLSAEEPIQLTLVLQQRPRVQEAIVTIAELHQGSREVRGRRGRLEEQRWLAPLETLAREARHGDVESMDAIWACLEHDSWQVRRAAESALVQVAARGGWNAFEAAIPLVQRADSGARRVIEAAVALLCDTDPGVRCAAQRVLSEMAQRAGWRAIDAVSPLVGSKDSKLRHAAVHALRAIAAKGDQHAVEVLAPLLGDADAQVQDAARSAMEEIAGYNGFFQAAMLLRCWASRALGRLEGRICV